MEAARTQLSVLRHLDVPAINVASRRESRSRQHVLPPITTFRWWARRTEAVTGALIEAAARDQIGPLLVVDPFAGGGVIALAALLRGHKVYAQDVNQWAANSLVTMLALAPPADIELAAERLEETVEPMLASAYLSQLADGSPAQVAHTLRVALAVCPRCETQLRLYPTALLSLTQRVDAGGTAGWLACPAGHIQFGSATRVSRCGTCNTTIVPSAAYTFGRRVICFSCGQNNPFTEVGPLSWEVVLVERTTSQVREIGPPTAAELEAADGPQWSSTADLGVITSGVETSVLRRHGFARWQDLYPKRQLAVTRALLDAAPSVAEGDERVLNVLIAAIIGSAEMAGLCSRWDGRYLKPYETVANHRYNFTTLSAEPNVWGAPRSGRGTVNRRLSRLSKAAIWYLEKLGHLPVSDGPIEASPDKRRRRTGVRGDAQVVKGSSVHINLADGSADLVCTDPPYHDDVSYGELSELFRAWADLPAGAIDGDATVVRHQAPDDTYERTLTAAFNEIRRVLRPDGHLVLSYANRRPDAWVALFAALEAASFHTVGFEVLSAENELDHAKAGKRSCTLDVILDLVKASSRPRRRHSPAAKPYGHEEEFCHIVGRWALRIGELPRGWREQLAGQLSATAFLAPARR